MSAPSTTLHVAAASAVADSDDPPSCRPRLGAVHRLGGFLKEANQEFGNTLRVCAAVTITATLLIRFCWLDSWSATVVYTELTDMVLYWGWGILWRNQRKLMSADSDLTRWAAAQEAVRSAIRDNLLPELFNWSMLNPGLSLLGAGEIGNWLFHLAGYTGPSLYPESVGFVACYLVAEVVFAIGSLHCRKRLPRLGAWCKLRLGFGWAWLQL